MKSEAPHIVQLADVRRAVECDIVAMSTDDMVMDQPMIVSDDRIDTSTTGRESPRATLPRRARNALLVVHIALSVALLGDVLALSAVTLKAMGTMTPSVLVGALVIGPAEGRLLDGPLSESARTQAEGIVLAGGLFDVVALLTAIGLSVFKPGRRRMRTPRPATL